MTKNGRFSLRQNRISSASVLGRSSAKLRQPADSEALCVSPAVRKAGRRLLQPTIAFSFGDHEISGEQR